MEKGKENKIKLGVFVTAGFVMLLAAIYLIGQRQHLFKKTFHLSGIFTDISGLQVGNNVRFSGINIGTVDAIEQVTDTSVKVDMRIAEESRKFIKSDAKAVIGSDGLMGDKILVILAGSSGSEIIKDQATLATTQPVSMDEILVNLNSTTKNAAVITEDLAAIIGNLRDGKGAIGKLFMDSVFANNIGDAIVNIKQGAGGFKQNMEAAGNNVLLRGYIKKKKRKEEEAREEQRAAREAQKAERSEAKAERKELRKEKRNGEKEQPTKEK